MANKLKINNPFDKRSLKEYGSNANKIVDIKSITNIVIPYFVALVLFS